MKLLVLDSYGTIELGEGLSSFCHDPVLPSAKAYHATGVWGQLCLQEINSESFSLQHFQVAPRTSFVFRGNIETGAIQALVNLRGSFGHKLTDVDKVTVGEKEFVVFNSAGKETFISIESLQPCTFVSLRFSENFYNRFSYLLEGFKELIKNTFEPFYFFSNAKMARYTVHDAIQAIWYDKYVPALTEKHIELRIDSVFFSLIAPAPLPVVLKGSAFERQKSAEAKSLILGNIRKHLTPEEIAPKIGCSPSFLIKAFKNVYQMGLFHFLRRTRMERAKEMLLSGSSLKEAAVAVGMNPSNFPKEFKKFFGYTVSFLIKNRQ
jgi:AraC-like DNA-binding protein